MSFFVLTGLCMCVKSLYSDSSGAGFVLGGFEDGTVVLWDERNPSTELHTCQFFAEPGRWFFLQLVNG